MSLAVVIPCHRRWDLLPRAVAAVAPHPVVVVDDSPPDLRPAPAPPPVAALVRTAGSQGFARAVNAGLRAAEALGARRVLLLNDDAVPAPGCIDKLCGAWGPGVGAVGPVLVDPGGQIESAGAVIRWWGRVRTRTEAPAADADVDGLSGACLLIASSHRLDEGFAHGFEDFALCRSIARSGQRVVLVAGARCVHLGGGTLGRQSRRAQRHAVSGHLRLLGRRRFVPVVAGLALAQVVREGASAGRAAGVAEGVADWWRSG